MNKFKLYICLCLFALVCSEPVYRKTSCDGKQIELKCNQNSNLKILEVHYGKTSSYICPEKYVFNNKNCLIMDVTEIVNNICSGKTSCVINAEEQNFRDTCPGENKYIRARFQCIYQEGYTPDPNENGVDIDVDVSIEVEVDIPTDGTTSTTTTTYRPPSFPVHVAVPVVVPVPLTGLLRPSLKVPKLPLPRYHFV